MSKTFGPSEKAVEAASSESGSGQELAAASVQGASVKELVAGRANREGDAYEKGARILGADVVTHPPVPPHEEPAGVFLNGLPAGTHTTAQVSGIPVNLTMVIAALEQYEQKARDVTVRVVLTPSNGALLDGEGEARHGENGALIFIGDAASVIENLSHVTLVAEGSESAQIGIGVTPIIPTAGGDNSPDEDNPADADGSDLAPFFARLSVSAGGQEQHTREHHAIAHVSDSGESLFSQDTNVIPLAGLETVQEQPAPPPVIEVLSAPHIVGTVIAPAAPVPVRILTASLIPQDQAPTDEAISGHTVSEGAANGAIIGTVTSTDPDAGDHFTYAIHSQDTAGMFAINASTGLLTVADNSQLNYDSATAHTITVQTTDSGGLTFDKQFTINVGQVALTGITDTDGTTNTVAWGVASGTATGLTAHATNPHGDVVTYNLASSANGAFTIDSSTGIVTVADPTQLNAVSTPDPTITVRATEASGQHVDQAYTIHVSDHAPTTTGPLDLAVVTSVSATTAVSVDTHTLFADADIAHGDALHYSYTLNAADSSAAMPGWLSFDTATGVFSGTATAAYTQDLNFTLTATDSAGESVSTTADLAFESSATLGTSGNDILSSSGEVFGLAGNDGLTAMGSVNTTLNGGAGNDTLVLQQQ